MSSGCATAQKKLRAAAPAVIVSAVDQARFARRRRQRIRVPAPTEKGRGQPPFIPPWLQHVLPQCTHAQWAGEEAQRRLLQAASGGMLPGRRCGKCAGWLDPDARTEVAQHSANAHNQRGAVGGQACPVLCPLRICATTAVIAKHGIPHLIKEQEVPRSPQNPPFGDGREWSNGCPNAVGRHPPRLSLKTLDWTQGEECFHRVPRRSCRSAEAGPVGAKSGANLTSIGFPSKW